MSHNKRYKKARDITIIGAICNLLLGLIKIVGGIWFKSHALFADGVHSFSDLFTDAMVLIASKYGSQEADARHPYGHQRIETAATLFLAMLLILAGSGIALDSINVLLYETIPTPQLSTIPIIALSVILNEILFHVTNKIGKEINSKLLIANAWHHRSDAASSLIVLFGVLGAIAGFKYLDPIAAIIIGALIIKMGINYGWDSVKELIDTAVSQQIITKIEDTINSIDGVQQIHQLRNRMMGKDIFVDAHILVSPQISVSEGHHIAQSVHNQLIDSIPQLKDVTIHVDPEDDELSSPSLFLPSRKTIDKNFVQQLKKDFPEINSWTVHYLNGKIILDLIIDKSFTNWDNLLNRLKEDIQNQPNISIINLLNIKDAIVAVNKESI
jgi:cation diffusion facilitator family transporter